MKDFDYNTFELLLSTLLKNGYENTPLKGLVIPVSKRRFSFRHDIDRKPLKALAMAKIESKMGVSATYYFRTTKEVFDSNIIKAIAALGHDIGYHYENLSTVAKKIEANRKWLKGVNEKLRNELDAVIRDRGSGIRDLNKENWNDNVQKLFREGINDFEQNLEKFQKIVPISTIAMHGMPLIPIDNRLLWLKYNYKDYGLAIEPYFDIDYNEVLYLTDAGRTWYDPKANQRDKVQTKFKTIYCNAFDIIKASDNNELPNQLLINIHPEHWTGSPSEWLKIWFVRKAKNTIKRIVLN